MVFLDEMKTSQKADEESERARGMKRDNSGANMHVILLYYRCRY